MDSSVNVPHDGLLCTRAITGSVRPAHQSIFICETCQWDADTSQTKSLPACICQSCAEVCHSDHSVAFVGEGPCTCDCGMRDFTCQECQLVQASKAEASRLGFSDSEARLLNDPMPLRIPPLCTLMPISPNSDIGSSQTATLVDHRGTMENNQWLNNLCIDCNSSICGFTFGSFHIPSLSDESTSDKFTLSQSLIQQAQMLVDCSRETFWIPMEENSVELCRQSRKYCDLEILAAEIYWHHVKAYNLDHLCSSEIACKSGAEWWVQVKPAGSRTSPIDLHYDKDEALAESFGLGSFPTLSTVTYLTGQRYGLDQGQREFMENEPTLIFPHTYSDEMDQPIPAMLLSHAVRGKHIAFDGRLLHGSPSHPALRLPLAPSDEKHCEPALRVTFLVNIWRTGHPSGVQILPESIRTKIISVEKQTSNVLEESLLKKSIPLEFVKSSVSQYSAPTELAIAMSDNPNMKKIILPFVSKGATWINDNEIRNDGKEEEEDESAAVDKCNTVKDVDDETDFGDEYEEEEEEVFLILPQYASQEYIQSRTDTTLFFFQNGNEARISRYGME